MRPSRPPEASASACEAACCRSVVCVSWQYRDGDGGLSTGTSVGDGCSHGADVRIGLEKDGPAAWCEASPPKLWRGEQLGDRSRACGDDGWRTESLAGQCFGLGDRVA